ncbi:MAG: hypothetical protein AAFS10_17400, partial [Myxococcota bacterium]
LTIHLDGQGLPLAPTIRVVVTDTSGQSETVDHPLGGLEDDEESPVVELEEPVGHFGLRAGEVFEVRGVAEDNQYIDAVTVHMLAEGQPEPVQLHVDWIGFERFDEVLEERVPNPLGLGSVVLAQRFRTTFRGRVRVPSTASAGDTLQFHVGASDLGVNTQQSDLHTITVLDDDVAPRITLVRPNPLRVPEQRTGVLIQAEVTDDVQLSSASMTVTVPGAPQPETVTMTESDAVAMLEMWVDTPGYSSTPGDNILTVEVVAVDTSGMNGGNRTEATFQVEIAPDEQPTLTLVGSEPAEAFYMGEVNRYTYRVEDDWVDADTPLRHATVYSTLSGLDEGGARGLSAFVEDLDEGDAVNPVPFMALSYPESSEPFVMTVDGQPYLDVDAGQMLRVWPRVAQVGGTTKLNLENNGAPVSWRVLAQTQCDGCGPPLPDTCTDGCSGDGGECACVGCLNPVWRELTSIEVTDWVSGDGLDLEGLLGASNATVIEVIPDGVSSEFPVERVWVYTTSSSSRPLLTTVLRDEQAAQGKALLGVDMLQEETAGRTAFERTVSLVIPEQQSFASTPMMIVGMVMDWRSTSPLAHQTLAERVVERDQSAPAVAFASPVNGVDVVRGERLKVTLNAEDLRGGGVASVVVVDHNNEPIYRTGGGFGSNTYTFYYDVPRQSFSNHVGMRALVTDRSGHVGEAQLELPMVDDREPTLEYERFHGGGDTIVERARLNQGEFWVSQDSAWSVEFIIADDVGLKSFEMYTLDALGQLEGAEPLYRMDFAQECPDTRE